MDNDGLEFAIINTEPRSCDEIHQQIAGYMEHSNSLFQCEACGQTFQRGGDDG